MLFRSFLNSDHSRECLIMFPEFSKLRGHGVTHATRPSPRLLQIDWMQSLLGILRTRGGELETNPKIKWIEIKSSSMNRSQVELMAWQYGAWTYGLGKGWLVGMKLAARAAALHPYRRGRLDGLCWGRLLGSPDSNTTPVGPAVAPT